MNFFKSIFSKPNKNGPFPPLEPLPDSVVQLREKIRQIHEEKENKKKEAELARQARKQRIIERENNEFAPLFKFLRETSRFQRFYFGYNSMDDEEVDVSFETGEAIDIHLPLDGKESDDFCLNVERFEIKTFRFKTCDEVVAFLQNEIAEILSGY